MSVRSRVERTAKENHAQPGKRSAEGLLVRTSQHSDLPQLAELVRDEVMHAQHLATYYRVPGDFDWLGFTKARLGGPRRAVLVAERAGLILGFIDLCIRSYEPPSPSRSIFGIFRRRASRPFAMPIESLALGSIEACYVMQQCRGEGIGGALVSAAVTWFGRCDIRRIELGVLANNSAVGFWESHGFKTFRLSMCTTVGEEQHRESP